MNNKSEVTDDALLDRIRDILDHSPELDELDRDEVDENQLAMIFQVK